MKTLISYEEFAERYAKNVLPELDEENKVQVHVMRALEDATGIIVSHLGWLVDKNTGNIIVDIPVQFESALKTICSDIAFLRINDRVSSDEDAKEKYNNSVSLLEKIDKEYKGGLSGPNFQSSFIVDETDKDSELTDKRFFKKGEFV